jgi:hypothetical protein
MRVLIGRDEREREAWSVAAHSLWMTSHIQAEPLVESDLRARGLFWRPVDRRGGRMHDIISGDDCSTQFSVLRFLAPLLGMRGWVLFTDCDVVFFRGVRYMPRDPQFAVMVVKHKHSPRSKTKMDAQTQRTYLRKNWSSVMLVNCEHAANRRLTLNDVNTRHRDELHALYWLHDSEIGELPPDWNWLVGEQPMPKDCGIAHFTLGGPFTTGWRGAEHDDLWKAAQRRMKNDDWTGHED